MFQMKNWIFYVSLFVVNTRLQGRNVIDMLLFVAKGLQSLPQAVKLNSFTLAGS